MSEQGTPPAAATDEGSEVVPHEEPIVVVKDLCVHYGKMQAVSRVSFSIPRGEVFGFIGPNGAGKTSTIKVLATLLRPTSGSAHIAGIDVLRHPMKVRTKIGYVPDFFGVYEDLTTRQYMHFFAAAFGVPGSERDRLVEDLLRLTDLFDKLDAQVDSLSRGMKQRLSLARVLLHDPEVLLLDEPASGLDPRARIEIREFLKELQRMGKTILISSHILHELAHLCTRIGIIEAGKLVVDGSLQEIYRTLDARRSVHVQLADPSPELIAGIRLISGVADLHVESDRIALELREDELPVEDLLDAIHALGARIRMFQPEAMDMETVFMKLTEGKTA
ncbi:MAG: ABC transporter ATP-binding protein [Planctomycetota bacterium]